MKELSIEEKARAYDRVSKEVKDFFEGKQKMYSDVTQTLEYLFPELKESEDERIRKELIEYHKAQAFLDGKPNNKHVKYVAWLEKQGEIIKEWSEMKFNNIQTELQEMVDLKQAVQKHKFKIGDIISNGKVVCRVAGFVKNCVHEDCYFLVNVEMEKNGTRYVSVTDSEGKTHNVGEITQLCDQVDQTFQKVLEEKLALAWSEEDAKALNRISTILVEASEEEESLTQD